MSGPQVYLRWPPSFTFSALNPDPLPRALPPSVHERSFRAPFGIDKDLFHFALQPHVPIVFASCYIVTVFLLNAYNRRRHNKPWTVSRQRWFKYFVVLHNALLTLYSTATFLAMCRAFAHTWPRLNNEHGLAGVADALCKIHGPRGLGDAATFNSTINTWEVKNTAIHLRRDGSPDPTDYGRLWNEGLAFWGWIFYISKFYEVIDTLIILAKGKRSATLQTYHHAGAMLCMWAGIRYMSPPIWMFVFVNSFIHGLMYTYFTLSALGYRVPQAIKRSLTSLQIAQFVWGASYAAMHLFVQYDIPISTPYQVAHTISEIASSATSKVQSATSAISEVVATPSAIAWGALGKKILLRALGEEGLAERVHDKQNQPLNAVMEEKIEQFKEHVPQTPKYETRWRTDWTRIECLDTSGEAFAVYLNLFYLAPLTFLFARFFYKAYLKRGKPRTVSQGARQVVSSVKEGEKKTEETVEDTGKKLEGKIAKLDRKEVRDQLQRDVQSFKEGTYKIGRSVSEQTQELEEQISNATTKAKQTGKAAFEKSKEVIGGDHMRNAEQQDKDTTNQAKEAGKNITQKAQQTGKNASQQAQQTGKNIAQQAQQTGKDLAQQAQQTGKNVASQAQQNGKKAVNHAKQESKKLRTDSPNRAASPSKNLGTDSPNRAASPGKKSGTATPQSEKWFKSENDVKDESVEQEDNAANAPSVDQRENDSSAERIHKDGIDYVKQQIQSKSSDAPADGGAKQELLPAEETSAAESESKQDAILEASQASRPGVKDGMPAEWSSDREGKPRQDNTASTDTLDTHSHASIASLDEEDTDAMGKSGAIIDMAASKAEEVADKVDNTLLPNARPTSSSSALSSGKRSDSPTKLPRKLESRSQSRSQSPTKKPFAPPGGSGK